MARRAMRWVGVGLLLGAAAGWADAQEAPGGVRLTAFAGPAYFTGVRPRPMELGLSGEAMLLRAARGGLGAGALAEGGLFHPAISGLGNYYFSGDLRLAWDGRRRWSGALGPFAAAGYTRVFNATSTGLSPANAVNFGVGVDRALNEELWLRLEVRDQYTPGSGSHALVLRVGLAGRVAGE